MVKGPHDGDNAHCVDTASTGVSKDGDQHVLLEVERPRIHGERPVGERDLDRRGGQDGGHGSADGERQYLNANRRQGDLVLSVAEELVDEGEQDAGDEPQRPCSEGQAWQAWIVGGRHCEPYLLDGAVIVFLCHHQSIHPQTQIRFESKIYSSTLVDLNDVKKNLCFQGLGAHRRRIPCCSFSSFCIHDSKSILIDIKPHDTDSVLIPPAKHSQKHTYAFSLSAMNEPTTKENK